MWYGTSYQEDVEKSQKSAAQVIAELNIISNFLFPQKLCDVNFTNLTSMVGLQLLNLWLQE
jgi:hypothetical protein